MESLAVSFFLAFFFQSIKIEGTFIGKGRVMTVRGHFGDRLATAVRTKDSRLCVGLDPQLPYIPMFLQANVRERYGKKLEAVGSLFFTFNKMILDAVHPYAAVVKPQAAFYEIYGQWGMLALEQTIKYAQSLGLLVLLDAKRGDGGDTVKAYAAGYLGELPTWSDGESITNDGNGSPLRIDAMTVQPGIGSVCLKPFIDSALMYGSGIFVVIKSSFTPDSEVEQMRVMAGPGVQGGIPVWQEIALMVHGLSHGTVGESGYSSIGAVLGATKPQDADAMRMLLPDSWFLVPGYGAQGALAHDAVRAINGDGLGCIVNSSRGIIFAYQNKKSPYACDEKEFAVAAARAAQDARDELNRACEEVIVSRVGVR